MVRNSRRTLWLMLAAIFVGGCGSSPPVRYFSLQPMPIDYRQDGEDSLVLGLGALRLADYLKRSHMVTRGENNEILMDQEHRWAEPLGTSIQRTLATNVDRLMDTVAVVSFPDTDTTAVDYRLVGRLHRFDVDGSGLAVLEVQWRIQDADGDPVIAPRRDRYTATSVRGDPGANAAALTDTLGQYSRTISEVVADLPAPTDDD